jgi:hypothetical protein
MKSYRGERLWQGRAILLPLCSAAVLVVLITVSAEYGAAPLSLDTYMPGSPCWLPAGPPRHGRGARPMARQLRTRTQAAMAGADSSPGTRRSGRP